MTLSLLKEVFIMGLFLGSASSGESLQGGLPENGMRSLGAFGGRPVIDRKSIF